MKTNSARAFDVPNLNPNPNPNPNLRAATLINTQLQLGVPTTRRAKTVSTVYVFSASECREAYGVRAACCRFRQSRRLGNLRTVRKRQQAARTPYASRPSDALNTYLPRGEGRRGSG